MRIMKGTIEDKTKNVFTRKENVSSTEGYDPSRKAYYTCGVFRRIAKDSFGWILGAYKPGVN